MAEEIRGSGETDEPVLPLFLRMGALALTLGGIGLIAAGGARGMTSLAGFGMFCLGMAGFDGLYRGRVGFRQVALLLGPLAAGLGAWAAVAAGFLRILDLPIGPEVRALVIASASCAVAAVGSALLAARGPGSIEWGSVAKTFGALGRMLRRRPSPWGEPRPDPSFGAEPQSPPAGPVREG